MDTSTLIFFFSNLYFAVLYFFLIVSTLFNNDRKKMFLSLSAPASPVFDYFQDLLGGHQSINERGPNGLES